VADASECGNEPSGYIKCREFLELNLLASQEGLCSVE
jgi:hypothetical protein